MEKLLDGHGIIWDMDGVLVDTGETHFIAWQQTAAEAGKSLDYGFFQSTFGMNNAGILQKLFGDVDSAVEYRQVAERKEVLFRQAIRGNVGLLSGVRRILREFATVGAVQAVASSAPPENIYQLIDETGIREYFEAIVSGFDTPGKPHPDVFLKAAEAIGLPRDTCLVIEDSTAGVVGAKRAGMKCIAVTTTTTAAQLAEADLVVDSLVGLTVEGVRMILAG
jgi:HAD superfamily hydrolase (TIGR01509 family)